MRLAGRNIVVTGAASGFGKAMALRFAGEGADVAVLDLDRAGASAVAVEINETHGTGRASGHCCDVTDESEVDRSIRECLELMGSVHVLVNNAGWSHRNMPMLDVTPEEFRRVYETNVHSIYHTTRAIVPHWLKTGGGVMINISSTAGLRPRPGLTWYNSTKGAVNTLTKSMAVELAGDNIRVCGIAPVIGRTGLTETFMGGPDTPENRQRFVDSIPLGRFCHTEDVASAAVYLASDEAGFITGNILEVDGGRCI